MSYLFCFLIKCYQYTISPVLGPKCIYNPSCSHYAITAIQRYGVLKGGYLSMKRLLRCHPGHSGGYDPVP